VGLVDIEAVREHFESSRRALEAEPAKAWLEPSVTSRLVHNVSMEVAFRQFGRDYRLGGVIATGPEAEAPSPLRYFLTSIALCVEGWWAKGSALLGSELTSVEVDASLGIDVRGEHGFAGVPRNPQWLGLEGRIAAEASPEEVLAVVDLGNDRCPLLALVQRAVPVHERIVLNGQIIRDSFPARAAASARS
jgi:uncharacterized OsmC-like protein